MHKLFRLSIQNSFFILNIFWKALAISIVLIFICTDVFPQNNKVPLRMLAYQYLKNNQIDEAEIAFVKAIKTDPKQILNYRDLALLYLTEKNYSKAESTALGGLKLNANNTEVRAILATAYIQKKENQKAIAQLNEILKRNRKSVFAYYTLSNLDATGNYSLQKNYLLKAISISPSNIVLRLSLAEALVRSNKADSAIFYLQSVKKIAPAFSPALSASYDQLVQSLRSNDFSKAKIYSDRFHNLLELTGLYVEALAALEGPKR